MKDIMVICDRCKNDLAPLKTLDYEGYDKHYAKCVFGSFRRITLEEAVGPEYEDDQDFVNLYTELWEEEKIKRKGQN